MTVRVPACANCGSPVPVVGGQFLVNCRYCGHRYFLQNPEKPALVLQENCSLEDAKTILSRAFHQPGTDREFAGRAFLERALLYYVPFYDLCGTRAGYRKHPGNAPPAPSSLIRSLAFKPGSPLHRLSVQAEERLPVEDQTVFSSNSFQYYAPASSFMLQKLPGLDPSFLEQAVLEAKQIPFDPLELRRRGVLLAPELPPPTAETQPGGDPELVELQVRLVYLPVWELNFSFQGLIFKSYLNAADRTPLLVNSLADSTRNRAFSLSALLAFAVVLAHALRSGLNGSLMALIFFFAFAALFKLMADYLWSLFSGRFYRELLPGGLGSQIRPIRETSLKKVLASIMKRRRS